MKKIAVLYHANCPDGFGGAWAAWKKLSDKADYIPVRYNFPPPDIKDKDIFMIDFCYTEKEFMRRLLDNNKSLTIIDHHVSSKENFMMASGGVLDMEHSGAVLAWSHFNEGKKTPLFLRHLEDMDLWKFKMKGTKEISVLMESTPLDFKKWNSFVNNFEKAEFRKKIFEKGKSITEFSNAMIRKAIDKAGEIVLFAGHRTYAVNTPLFESEMGNELYVKLPPMSIMWYSGKDGIKVSLRSNGSVDVAKMAEKFGGGGHKGAAGFRLPKGAKLPWKEA